MMKSWDPTFYNHVVISTLNSILVDTASLKTHIFTIRFVVVVSLTYI